MWAERREGAHFLEVRDGIQRGLLVRDGSVLPFNQSGVNYQRTRLTRPCRIGCRRRLRLSSQVMALNGFKRLVRNAHGSRR